MKKKLSYKITTSPQVLDDQNNTTPELLKIIQKYHQMALGGKRSSVPKILKAIEKYPNSPQLKNYLSVLYEKLNETQKMHEANQWVNTEHPDYLFGKLRLANEYYSKKEYDKMPDVLGHEMELDSLYPDRKTFHLNEVTSFLQYTILYYTAIGNIEQAETRFSLLKELAADSADIKNVFPAIYSARIKAAEKRSIEEEKSRISVIRKPQKISTFTHQPLFIHQEIKELYCNGLNIEREKLETILSLPRETLIQDLESVLQDSINRYSYFQKEVDQNGWEEETMNFVIHAIYILAELNVSQSINAVLNVLSQSDEYIQLYLGDMLTELIWEPLFKIAANNLEPCKEFLFKPGINTFAKASVTEMVEQVALNYPKRADEVINWFSDVIQFFLNSDINDNVIDSDVIAFLICNVVEFKGDKLLPEIEKLFEKGIVSTGICGYWSEVNEAFALPDVYDKRRDTLSIFDRYKEITSTWTGYRKEETHPEFNFSDSFEPVLKPIRVQRKIGRNEPCPCGSGKKFKKCCIKK